MTRIELLEWDIRTDLEVYRRCYRREKRSSEVLADFSLSEAIGYRKGLERALDKEELAVIFKDYPELWEEYEE